MTAAAFPDALTDNGIQFVNMPKNRNGPTAQWHGHPFDRTCWRHGIEHRLTKPKHPWTNGQVEKMNRAFKEATVKRYHYDDHDQFRNHLPDFVNTYSYARRLKTLGALRRSNTSANKYVSKIWTEEPNRFRLDPTHRSSRLNT